MIAQNIYLWVVEVLFGNLVENEWYISHLEVIRGVTTVIVCAIVFLFAVACLVAVLRFFGRCAGGGN